MNTIKAFLVAIAAFVLAAAAILIHGTRHHHLKEEFGMLLSLLNAVRPVHLVVVLPAGVASIYHLVSGHPSRTVYLVEYACFEGEPGCRVPASMFTEHIQHMPFFDDCGVRFMTRMLERSGLGDETSLPPTLRRIPPYNSLDDARAEAELVIFSVIDDLLAKTGIAPDVVDVLVVNCSVFAPVPSLTDMIVNRYRLRSDVRSVNLSRMGCSAGPISIGLAAKLLQTAPHGAHALVVSTETITSNFYKGKEHAMQLSNVLFRMGGAAVLLSTSDARARFRLKHAVRTVGVVIHCLCLEGILKLCRG